jgi:hypothetical protein
MLELLWVEISGRRSRATLFNKSAVDLCWHCGVQDEILLLAGRGGEEEKEEILAFLATALLSAGLGGEGERGSGRTLSAPTRSRFVQLCCWMGSICILLLSLSRHGGAGRGGEVAAGTIWSRLLPEGCYLLELNHTRAIWAPVIFCRQGGAITTSNTEAFFESAAGARCLLFIKWFVPGDQKVTSGFDSSSKMELSSILLRFLGADALRTPATGGGGTQGPDCCSTFCPRVFSVI